MASLEGMKQVQESESLVFCIALGMNYHKFLGLFCLLKLLKEVYGH